MIKTHTLCAVNDNIVKQIGIKNRSLDRLYLKIIPPLQIMSDSVTTRSPSKCTQRSNDSSSAAVIGGSAANGSTVGGGSAASPDAAGNIIQDRILSPLKAALMLKATPIESLPIASRPFSPPSPNPFYSSLPASSTQKRRRMKRSPIQTTYQALQRSSILYFKPCLKYKRVRVLRLSVVT
jgi:hypothetical protein